ncbi:hypothetical protein [Pseudomonas sp. NPDC086251]|uniref:hypothetical protein n=1 Tax=Pseudomonas sp. NPDC086251 TaxID=3364431 RepID=UPI003838A899
MKVLPVLKTQAKKTSIRIAFVLTVLLCLGWFFSGLISLLMHDVFQWWRGVLRLERYLPHIASHVSVHALFGLLVLVELILFACLAWKMKKKHATTGLCLMIVGIPLLSVGLVAHIDARLTDLLAPTVPFPGWEAVCFILGTTLTLHGIFWERMVAWRRLSRAIDYLWYGGGIFAVVLGTTSYYKAQELTFFQATLVDYYLAKDRIIPALETLKSYCADAPLIEHDSVYSKSAHSRPSSQLCEMIQLERELWAADNLLTLGGTFDFHLLNPSFRHSTGSTAADLAYTSAIVWYRDSDQAKNGERMCKLAQEEWDRSGWARLENEALENHAKATPLPSYAMPIEQELAPIGERTVTLVISLPFGPPHRFGTDICEIRAEIVHRLDVHAGRSFVIIPKTMNALATSWSMVLGLFIAIRLLKTTVEFRNDGNKKK